MNFWITYFKAILFVKSGIFLLPVHLTKMFPARISENKFLQNSKIFSFVLHVPKIGKRLLIAFFKMGHPCTCYFIFEF